MLQLIMLQPMWLLVHLITLQLTYPLHHSINCVVKTLDVSQVAANMIVSTLTKHAKLHIHAPHTVLHTSVSVEVAVEEQVVEVSFFAAAFLLRSGGAEKEKVQMRLL